MHSKKIKVEVTLRSIIWTRFGGVRQLLYSEYAVGATSVAPYTFRALTLLGKHEARTTCYELGNIAELHPMGSSWKYDTTAIPLVFISNRYQFDL